MYLCAKNVANWEGEGWGMLPQGDFDFGPFIRRNLVKFGAVFAQT